jgi:diacylglycerol kinase (ATP)
VGEKLLPLVIVNPASRGGTGERDWPMAASTLKAQFGAFDRRFTEAPGHAAEIAQEEASAGRRLLLTFGGDGTISETARGILDSGPSGVECELGVLPHGTGGDFIRSLSVPRRLADAARGLKHGKTITIDVGRVVFADGTERRFVNSASFGLSGEVAYRANRSKKSGTSYARHTVSAALGFDFPEVQLNKDGAEHRVRITTVSLHNGRFFGGGMKMAPAADLTDGVLQMILVRKMSPLKLLTKAPLMYWGAHLGVAELEHGSISKLEAAPADSRQVIRVEVDGESPGQLPARFEVQPHALRVRMTTS